jgi:hypothetical protein
MWHCLNLVCGPEGMASGVLLRAGEIRTGAELTSKRRLSARHDRELAKGPARLATALDDRPRPQRHGRVRRPRAHPCPYSMAARSRLTRSAAVPVREWAVTEPSTPGASGSADDPSVSPYRAHTHRANTELDSLMRGPPNVARAALHGSCCSVAPGAAIYYLRSLPNGYVLSACRNTGSMARL